MLELTAKPKCDCGGELAIADEMKEDKWRVGFRLICKSCGKKWLFKAGHYFEDKSQ